MLHYLFLHRMLQLALKVVAEARPSSGKAKESYDALMHLVEGEKEVAWAEHQNSIILPHVIAPHVIDNMENISPAFLQSSGIMTSHLDPTQLHSVATAAVDAGDSFDDGNNGIDIISSCNANVTEFVNDSANEPTDLSCLHSSKNVTPCWAERTPVAMAIDQERGVTTPLTCTSTVTKLPKSPHPRALQATLETTHVITSSNRFNKSIKSSFVPSSLAKEKQTVGMRTNKHNSVVTTPKSSYKCNVNDIINASNHTPGSKQPFANLPPIFAPTLMKTKSESPDEVPLNNCHSQTRGTDSNVDTSAITGFEDDFVPFNAHDNKNLSPDQEVNDITYHIDKEASVTLNQTYTQALCELDEEEDAVDSRHSKAAARKVGQEIWQKVNSDYPFNHQSIRSHPLRTVQCDAEQGRKVPGYLTMTKSAAIKRLPPTMKPLLKSNKENIPGGRKRTNTMKQSNRTMRPLARSASLKARPVTYNW